MDSQNALLGVRQLTTFSLPIIKRTVDDLLESEKKKLKQLPPKLEVDSPLSTILQRVLAFCRALHGSVLGDLDKGFIQRNQKRYGDFKDEVQRTAPRLEASWRPLESAKDTIYLNDISATIAR